MKPFYILIVLLLMIILFVICLLRYNTMLNESYWTEKNKDTHNDLLSLLDNVVNKLRSNNIDYFLIGGTLLGSVRNKKIIPWDDDIDIAIYYTSGSREVLENKLKNIFDNNPSLTVEERHFGFKIFGNKTNKFIDIFLYTDIDGRVMHGNKKSRKLWPTAYFYKEELENLELCEINGNSYNCPMNPENALKRQYGDDAITTGRITHLHSSLLDNIIVAVYSKFLDNVVN